MPAFLPPERQSAGALVAGVTVVATVATATRQRPPAKKRPPARRKNKGGTTAAARNKAKREALQRRHARVVALRRGLSRGDVWGALLLVGAVLVALGTWADVGGPVGRGLDDSLDDAVGVARFALPPVLAWVGLLLVRGKSGDGTSRIAAGLALTLIAGDGLVQVVDDDLGGTLGRLVGGTLERLLSPWGASLVLVAGLTAAMLVLTATTVRTAAGHLSTAGTKLIEVSQPAVRASRRALHWFTTLPTRDPTPETSGGDAGPAVFVSTDSAPVLFDGMADALGDLTTEIPSMRAEPVPPLEEPDDPEQLAIDLGPAGERSPWKLPPLSLLERMPPQEVDRRLVEQAGRTLERALAAHGVETRLVGMTVGPTVTRYELELGPGVKVARVTSLNRDIAYAMASPDVRILAPIPGRSAIGVEVPNTQRQLVAVGDILASEEAARATHPCEVALGRDISGRAVLANLAEMPHLLIAGATGAGKSSCLNSLLTSVLVRSTPEQVRLILVDPKRVELGQYNGLPHLLTPVVTSPKKAANALAWAVKEMERRYDLLSEVGVRDITGYNGAVERGELRTDPRAEGVDDPGERIHDKLPFVIVVVDELNDLMMVAARDVEESICRIAQMARAVGIHLVIATQRPSVNVITGVIKANIPARMAFAVSSLADSRVILDQGGAERLVGRGDMLLLGAASSTPRRIQGSWVGEDEVQKVVAHWRRQAPKVVSTMELVGDDALLQSGSDGRSGSGDDDDELCRAAMDLIVRSQLGSTSMLQRKLRVGFARAGRLMDLLEQRGVVGPSTGSKARDVLMTIEELDDLQGNAEQA